MSVWQINVSIASEGPNQISRELTPAPILALCEDRSFFVTALLIAQIIIDTFSP